MCTKTDPTAASQEQPVQGRIYNRSIVRVVGSILGLQESDHVVQTGGPIGEETWVVREKLRGNPGKPVQPVSMLSSRWNTRLTLRHRSPLVKTWGQGSCPQPSLSTSSRMGQCLPAMEPSLSAITVLSIVNREAVSTFV